jgi:hypothetical protein
VLQRTRQQPRAAERDALFTAPSRRLQKNRKPRAVAGARVARRAAFQSGAGQGVVFAAQRLQMSRREGKLPWAIQHNRALCKMRCPQAANPRALRITPVMSCALAPAALSLCGLLLQAFSPCPPLGVGSKTGLVMRRPSAFCCVVAARVVCLWCCRCAVCCLWCGAASRAIV